MQITTSKPASSGSPSAAPLSLPDPAKTLGSLRREISRLGISERVERNAALGGRSETVLVAADGSNLDEARRLVEEALAPAEPAAIAQWLVALRLITAHRTENTAEARLALRLYVDRLRQWPADCVAHAILRQRWRWWPALAEIEEVVEDLAAPRRRLALQLRTGWGIRPAALPAASGPQPADVETRRRIVAEVLGRAAGRGRGSTAPQPMAAAGVGR